jgi:hypothetical protein
MNPKSAKPPINNQKKDKQQKKGTKPENQAQSNNQTKGGKQNKANKQNFEAEDVNREQKLQAILLADSFTKTFRPVSLETPKVLLPLVNVPMLEYSLEFLAQNGVEEVSNIILIRI